MEPSNENSNLQQQCGTISTKKANYNIFQVPPSSESYNEISGSPCVSSIHTRTASKQASDSDILNVPKKPKSSRKKYHKTSKRETLGSPLHLQTRRWPPKTEAIETLKADSDPDGQEAQAEQKKNRDTLNNLAKLTPLMITFLALCMLVPAIIYFKPPAFSTSTPTAPRSAAEPPFPEACICLQGHKTGNCSYYKRRNILPANSVEKLRRLTINHKRNILSVSVNDKEIIAISLDDNLKSERITRRNVTNMVADRNSTDLYFTTANLWKQGKSDLFKYNHDTGFTELVQIYPWIDTDTGKYMYYAHYDDIKLHSISFETFDKSIGEQRYWCHHKIMKDGAQGICYTYEKHYVNYTDIAIVNDSKNFLAILTPTHLSLTAHINSASHDNFNSFTFENDIFLSLNKNDQLIYTVMNSSFMVIYFEEKKHVEYYASYMSAPACPTNWDFDKNDNIVFRDEDGSVAQWVPDPRYAGQVCDIDKPTNPNMTGKHCEYRNLKDQLIPREN